MIGEYKRKKVKNMPVVSFWSTEESAKVSTTATTVAASLMLAIKENYKILVTQTHYSDMSLESSFFSQEKNTRVDTSDKGIDALDRLLRSGKLRPESIPNYAVPVLKGKLELLYGSFKNDMDSYARILETMPSIIDQTRQFYDIVLVDLNKGNRTGEMNKILQQSDLIVLGMNQDISSLKQVFKDMQTVRILQEKKVIPVLARYDRYSEYKERNIARKFNYKKRIYTIPYNTQFFDACNKGEAADFFISNARADISDRNGFFISEVNLLTDAIMDAVKDKIEIK